MQINMDDSRITSIAQLKDFLNGSKQVVVSLEHSSIAEKYQFIEKTIKQFLYQKLKKKDKKTVVLYLRKITAYKKAQLYKLIQRAEKGLRRNASFLSMRGCAKMELDFSAEKCKY